MDKFICNYCGYSLIIKKGGESVIKISKPSDFIDIMNSRDVYNYELLFKRQDLELFIKKNSDSDNILQAYDRFIKKNTSKYVLKCSSCAEEFPLEPETVIYTINQKSNQLQFNDDNIDLRLNDPTLPRTKDYICVNSECETNSKNYDLSKKEAIFYRSNKSYHLKYACTICKHSWFN
jgi:hypothetical protein